MSYYKECLVKFSQLPAEIKEKIGNEDKVLIIGSLEQKYSIELGFLVVLVMIGEVSIKDIPDYLVKKYSIEYNKAETIKSELMEAVFGSIVEDMDIDIITAEKELRDIFKNNLVDAFFMDEDSQIEINARIIFVLSMGKPEFQEEIARSLLDNKEILTHQPFVLDGKQKQPSVGNWLGYFIKEEGSAMPNNMTISQFIINSKNAKILDGKDRDALGKMLILYRNLKFFPDSLVGLPFDDWYFIPVEKSEILLKARDVSGPPKTAQEKKIEELVKVEETLDESSLERRVIEEEGVKNERRIEDLQFMASKFADGSLEKKAVEEEIKKLEKRIEGNKQE